MIRTPPGKDKTKERDPLKAGLYRALRDGGFAIDPVRWSKAAEAGDLVGECRHKGCEGFLVVDDDRPEWQPPERHDYTARCLFCDTEIVAPGGRVLHKSGCHNEAAAFWAGRTARLRNNTER